MKRPLKALTLIGVLVLSLATAVDATANVVSQTSTSLLTVGIKRDSHTRAVKFYYFRYDFTGGPYEICVDGPQGSTCIGRELRPTPGDAYHDQLVWKRNFPTGPGRYTVTWIQNGMTIGPPLHFRSRKREY